MRTAEGHESLVRLRRLPRWVGGGQRLRRLVLRASGAYEPDVPLRFDLRPAVARRPGRAGAP